MRESQEEKDVFDNRLLECVNMPKLRSLLEEYKYNIPPDINRDTLGMLRILVAKFSAKISSVSRLSPMQLKDMSKALRPVLIGNSFTETVFSENWFVLPNNKGAPFVRGWHETIYAPANAREGRSNIGANIESILHTGSVLQMEKIEQRTPRIIRFRRGTYAHIIFDFKEKGVVELGSSAESIDKTPKRISVPTADLAAALLLLKKGNNDIVRVSYQPEGYLTLANERAFVAFTQWTVDMGPLPPKKK